MASCVSWVWTMALNTPSCVRADGGGEPFPVLLGLVTGALSSPCLVPLFTEPFPAFLPPPPQSGALAGGQF